VTIAGIAATAATAATAKLTPTHRIPDL
jgi:hypothetical protein